ncbi:helix-turn-helix domain-containing protein [Vogesella sp. XCS3]|uniref:helix-turn-helix domain-containing protein n=1 Tax=Vogesella sp. XCS3 TaxID=2877939 RepID=UPI001D0A49BA|nr:helix-turn-helix transcriptional regulator [Vogesella sp. XCS3]UDM18827.1 helix-turn-helix domain-containing protein [Vogesella sp. XCS3]
MNSQHTHNRAFGIVLRDLRRRKGYSQEELGFEADLARNYVSLMELGQRSPTLDTIVCLCNALGISLPAFAALIQAKVEEIGQESEA